VRSSWDALFHQFSASKEGFFAFGGFLGFSLFAMSRSAARKLISPERSISASISSR